MRESGFGLNHLLYMQQLALIQADAALNEAARVMHLRMARTYEDEITRRTQGRLRFGRKPATLIVEDSPAAEQTRVLAAA
jgi:hypothetical protein